MNRREFVTGLVALPALVRPASAEVSTINLGKQHGLPFLPQMVMEDRKLIEAHALRFGVNGLGVGWQTMGGPGALNDGLLSGTIQFVNVASPSLATLWDKTFGTPQEVRAVCAVQSMPYILTTRNPAVKTIADFSAADRIAYGPEWPGGRFFRPAQDEADIRMGDEPTQTVQYEGEAGFSDFDGRYYVPNQFEVDFGD